MALFGYYASVCVLLHDSVALSTFLVSPSQQGEEVQKKKGLKKVSRFTEQGKVRAPVAQELVEGKWLRGFRGIYPCRLACRSVAWSQKGNLTSI